MYRIDEKEYVFYIKEEGKLYDEKNFIIFYDISTEKIIEKLKVGNGENDNGMKLINNNNLIIPGVNTIIFIDVKMKNY